MAVVEFLDAIGTWVEETLLKRLRQAPYYSIMADECTDVSTIEELSIYCRWIENGEATEHYIEIVPPKNAGAENIRFSSSDIVGSFSIFDPRKVPADKTSYGNESAQTLVTQYASDLPAVSLDGTDFVQEGIISTEVSTEWKTYLPLLSKQNGDLKSQLKELTTNEMMIALLPNLHKLAAICLTLPVSTASVEWSFSHMK